MVFTNLQATLKSVGATADRQAAAWQASQGKFVTSTALSGKALDELRDKYRLGEISVANQQARVNALTAEYGTSNTTVEAAAIKLKQMQNALSELGVKMQSGGKVIRTSLADSLGLIPPVARMSFDEIVKLGDELSRTTLFTHEQINTVDAMLLTFTNIGKDVFPAATVAVANMGQKFGSLDSAAIQVGKALQDPINGVTALRRVGVMLTDQQEKQITAFIKQGKTAEAQKLILAELETEFGGLAQAMGKTTTGKMTILKHAFDEVLETVGANFLPVISVVADKVLPMLDTALKAIQPTFEDIGLAAGVFVNVLTLTGSPVLALRQAILEGFPQFIPVFDNIVAKVNEFLASIQPLIDQVATWLAQNVSLQDVLIALGVAIAAVVIPAIWSVVSAAAPIVAAFIALVAISSLLRQAWETDWGGIRTTLTAFWEGTAKPALAQLWAWLAVNVPAAIQTLANFWNNTLLPALSAVWSFIQINVLPILATVWAWLAVNVPAAIQTLANFWNNTLLPALSAVWSYLNGSVIPLWMALANVYMAAVNLAVTALAGLWQNVLLPALTFVWVFIETSIMPSLLTLGTFLSTTLGPIIVALASIWLANVKVAFDGIVIAIQAVIGWLNGLATSINSLTLPSWLTPGSATPLEEGLTGVSVAAAQASLDLGTMLATAIQHVGNVLKTDLDYWLGEEAGLLYLLKQTSAMSGQAMAWATKYEAAFYVMRAAIADAGAAAAGLLSTLEDIKAIGTINTWVITHYKDVYEPPEDNTGGAGGTGGGGGVHGRAVGGPVAASTPYLVGEAGPEIFMPNVAGRIVPNGQQFINQLNAAMGRIIQATAASVSASMERMPELAARGGGAGGPSSSGQHVTIYGLTLNGVQDARGLLGELQAMT